MTDVAAKPQFSRSRSILSGAVILLTCVTLLSSILALWAEHSLLDTNRFTDGVEKQLDVPAVSEALGNWVGEQVGSLIQTETIKDVLPGRLDIIAPFLTNTIQSFASDKASEFVQSDTGKTIVVRAVQIGRAHV